ncbi:tetraacyldisaccharide 4'-kinase [Caulobacter sp. KR2-114]|uniref:tetraacyldisaccharide 4'-kinase n=1 Tax=Caulobacter sp. KR2-114 TaxID=3400912 RepID=UPI003C02950A
MRLATPRWWYVREGAPMRVTRLLARPASWIWAWATARRLAQGQPVDPGAPVICVGNLTLGGTGKTPVARALALRLAARGWATAVLSRGYGGALKGPVRVDPQTHTAADVGDEPLMLAMGGQGGDRLTVWVARDRTAGALAAVAAGAQAIVQDDGFQNPALRKTMSLVVVDGETRDEEWPFGDGAVFPAGPMREPLAAGLERADAVVVLLPADLADADPALLNLFAGKPVLTAHLQPVGPPPAGPQLGFAGVGKPWKVEAALRAAGCQLVDFAPFADHQRIPEGVLRFLERRAGASGAGLVTSEKDWARLPPAWRAKVTPWPVRARFDDEAALDALLTGAGL